MNIFMTVAALCAALFSITCLANEALTPFPHSKLNCSVNGPTTVLKLNTTANIEPIQVSLVSGQGNTMMSQVSGKSNNRFQIPTASLPATLSLSNGAVRLQYQVVKQGDSCLIIVNG